jgi:hypothetical protein
MNMQTYTIEALAEESRQTSSSRNFNSTPGHSHRREQDIIAGALATGDFELLYVLASHGYETSMHLLAAAVHGLRIDGITDLSEDNVYSRIEAVMCISDALSARGLESLTSDTPCEYNLLHYAAANPDCKSMLLRTVRSRVHKTPKDIIETTEIMLGVVTPFHVGVL